MPKAKRGRKKAAVAGASSGEEESEAEPTQEEDMQERPRPKPRPRRTTRANPDAAIENAAAESTGDEGGPVTPKARPRGKVTYRRKSPSQGVEPAEGSQPGSPLQSLTPSEEGQAEPEEVEPEQPEDVVTPKSTLKRPRPDDDDVSNGMNGADDDAQDDEGTPDIQVRRKRIRH
jgi:cohesin complex subunit SA-1/2